MWTLFQRPCLIFCLISSCCMWCILCNRTLLESTINDQNYSVLRWYVNHYKLSTMPPNICPSSFMTEDFASYFSIWMSHKSHPFLQGTAVHWDVFVLYLCIYMFVARVLCLFYQPLTDSAMFSAINQNHEKKNKCSWSSKQRSSAYSQSV